LVCVQSPAPDLPYPVSSSPRGKLSAVPAFVSRLNCRRIFPSFAFALCDFSLVCRVSPFPGNACVRASSLMSLSRIFRENRALTLFLVLFSDQAGLDLSSFRASAPLNKAQGNIVKPSFSCRHVCRLVFSFISHHVHVPDRTIHHQSKNKKCMPRRDIKLAKASRPFLTIVQQTAVILFTLQQV
jgi:hypothetical protein